MNLNGNGHSPVCDGSRWVRCTARNRCPICDHPDWCCLSGDGAVAMCMRVGPGSFREGRGKSGQVYYLHRLHGQARAAPAIPQHWERAAVKAADPATLDVVYQALLATCPLVKADREDCHRRGLDDDDLARLAYGTLPADRAARWRIARVLWRRFGDDIFSVPGFVTRTSRAGRRYIEFNGWPGLLVPARAIGGRVAALRVRKAADGQEDQPRWSYLSSEKHGGPSSGAPAHVPLGVAGPAERVVITEGERKSDVAHRLAGWGLVGVSGVGTWASVLPILRELGGRVAALAFDADACRNHHVARAQADLYDALRREGYVVELLFWDAARGKGLDDLLLTGGEPELLTGHAVEAHVRRLVATTAPVTASPTRLIGRGPRRTATFSLPWGVRS
jgi:hypothetical protein